MGKGFGKRTGGNGTKEIMTIHLLRIIDLIDVLTSLENTVDMIVV